MKSLQSQDTSARRRGARCAGFAFHVCVVAAVLVLSAPAQAERIRDLAVVQGVRGNQLIGYGLVVGLDGSGDQTTQTAIGRASIRARV
jgi:flagellar P-ring protein precursor FlgI